MQKIIKGCISSLTKYRGSLDACRKVKLAELAGIDDVISCVDESMEDFKLLLKKASDAEKVVEKGSNCTNKVEIMELISEVIAENGPLEKNDLKKEVDKKLRKLKRNLSIFSKLFEECVEEVDFTTMVAEELALAKARNGATGAVTQH